MNQQFKQLFEKLLGYWKQLEKRQRRNLILVGVFFILTVSLLSWFAFRPNYVVVFANQTPASLGELSQKLDELKIPNQVGSDSISVPEQYQHEATMKLAMEGLPQTGTLGYSVFDKTDLGMTAKEFDVRYQQAIEGNIANAIRTIKGVQDAKVSVVQAEEKLFVAQEQQNAKASVLLALAPGMQLTNEQVTGIQQLVSHSVKGLVPQNVTIVDQNGTRLVDDAGEALAANGSSSQLTKQQQIQIQVEQEATKKIRNALERIVGLNNAAVVVHADVDFNKRSWTDKKLTPPIEGATTGGVISQRESSEETQGTTGGGAAGQQQNNNNQQQLVNGGQGTQSSSKKDDTTNFEWNTYVENGATSEYRVQQYTVSVLLNKESMTPQEREDITNFVSTAIGRKNDGTANDVITVTGKSFVAPANPFETEAFYQQPWFLGAMAAALVLLGGGAYALTRRRKQTDVPVLEAPVTKEIAVAMEESESQKMKKQLEKLANQKPEEFVNLLRTWLVEE
ncbi:flagellar M-ring protein FliF [Tumebacillus sp. BK434]|uniref:flagellar basal-body MS-ring/collar protein FliF n=1 Tax=Tumebacillus sp. BK434 TaxID=2512169 RepID=UPI0010D1DE72|nr:flagellar basal-body MS-ring/collar protein FliF [Tumebacillus sp. BK434]TCP58817.1 flagellar M-ring protein FliF [Tumebacillus sp. BK434]